MSINNGPFGPGARSERDYRDRQTARFQRDLATFGHEAARRFSAAKHPIVYVLPEEPPLRPEPVRRGLFRRSAPPPAWPAPLFGGWPVLAADPRTGELRTGALSRGQVGYSSLDPQLRVTTSVGLLVTPRGECVLISSCVRGEGLPGEPDEEDEAERYHLVYRAPGFDGTITADLLAWLYGFDASTQDRSILDYLAGGVEVVLRGGDRFA